MKAVTEELSKATNPIFTKLYSQAQADAANGGAQSASDDGTTINVDPDDIK